MSLFRRKKLDPPAIQLYDSAGNPAPLRITFRNGEIHINPDAMDKGSYQLCISQGKERANKYFTIY